MMKRCIFAVLAMLFFVPLASADETQGCVWNDCSGPQVGGGGQCVPDWVCPIIPPGCRWETCEGPQIGGSGPCSPGIVCPNPILVPEDAIGPAEMCLGDAGCFPVRYSVNGLFVIAESPLPNGYPVMGWSGPCFGALSTCPDAGKQAFTDLRLNALRINRGLRFGR
jgi:hypothetical protein